MNTGQMLITIGAMVILSMIILRTSNNNLNTNVILYNTKFEVLATSLGTSIIEEANSKSFDEFTDTTFAESVADLTTVLLLGPETGEVYPDFDDFDDFNNYQRIDSTMPSAIFNISCSVNYVTSSNPDLVSNSRTWSKNITVTITSQSMRDTIRMSSIFSYWFFR